MKLLAFGLLCLLGFSCLSISGVPQDTADPFEWDDTASSATGRYPGYASRLCLKTPSLARERAVFRLARTVKQPGRAGPAGGHRAIGGGAGIEGTNSGLKRCTGLGRLPVLGRPRVFMAIYLKITGWNILRTSVCAAMRTHVAEKVKTAFCSLVQTLNRLRHAGLKRFGVLRSQITHGLQPPAPNPIRTIAPTPRLLSLASNKDQFLRF